MYRDHCHQTRSNHMQWSQEVHVYTLLLHSSPLKYNFCHCPNHLGGRWIWEGCWDEGELVEVTAEVGCVSGWWLLWLGTMSANASGSELSWLSIVFSFSPSFSWSTCLLHALPLWTRTMYICKWSCLSSIMPGTHLCLSRKFLVMTGCPVARSLALACWPWLWHCCACFCTAWSSQARFSRW